VREKSFFLTTRRPSRNLRGIAGEAEASFSGSRGKAIEQEKQDAALAEILGHNVNDVLDHAESLSLDELRQLKAIEESAEKKLLGLKGGPRKQVLEGLEALIELREEEATAEETDGEA